MSPVKIIDVFGQFDNKGTDHYYVFTNGNIEFSAADKKYFNDPRELPSSVSRAYATFCTPAGWWLSVIAHNPHDSRHGFAMVSVCIGENRPTDGHQAKALLDALFQQLVEQHKWDDTETAALIGRMPLDVRRTPLLLNDLTQSQGRGAFRPYATENDLTDYLSAIWQTENKKFARVFFVSASDAELMKNSVQALKTPFRKVFSIEMEDPKNTRVSKPEAFEGETITVTYSCAGASDMQKTFEVGKMSEVAYAEGSKMIVKSASKAGANFTKRVFVKFSPAVEVRLENADSLRRQGIDYNQADGALDIPVNAGGKIVLQFRANGFKANGFKPTTTEIAPDSLRPGEKINVALEAEALKLIIHTYAGDFEANEDITYNSPRYKELIHNGAEHSVNNSVNKLILDATRQKQPAPRSRQDYEPSNEKSKFYLKLSALILVVLLLFGGVYYFFFTDNEKTEQTSGQSKTDSGVKDDDRVKDPKKDEQAELENNDIKYLNNNNVWDFTQLKSDKFKNFANGLSKNSIPDGWDKIDNEVWKSIMDLYKKVDDSKQQTVRSTITKAVSDNKLDLKKLDSDLNVIRQSLPDNSTSGTIADITGKGSKEEHQEISQTQTQSTASPLDEDIAYMKKNDTWKKNDLKSAEAKAFFDKLASAESIDGITSLKYPSKTNVNGYWKTLVKICKSINSQEKSEKFMTEFKKSATASSIDLKQLSTDAKLVAESKETVQAKGNGRKKS